MDERHPNGGAAQISESCYDGADRLLSTSGPGAVPAGQAVYDSRGNTTQLGSQLLAFDGANRNTQLRDSASSTAVQVSYVRDATDRIVQRTSNGTAANSGSPDIGITKYSFTGGGDTPDLVLDAGTHAVVERTVALPGGVVLTMRPGTAAPADQVWAYPNVHGDVIATAGSNGAKAAKEFLYDPYGQPLDPSTLAMGTSAANDSVPDTSAGHYDNGWLGQHQRGYEHAGNLALIQMGARVYSPLLGRFLSVDSVEGGSANDYVDANPINAFDLDGTWNPLKKVKQAAGWVHRNAGTIGTVLGVIAIVASGPFGIALGIAAAAFSLYSAGQNLSKGNYKDAAFDATGGMVGAGAAVKGVRAIKAAKGLQKSRNALGRVKGAANSRKLKRAATNAMHRARRNSREAAGSTRRWSNADKVLGAVGGSRLAYQERQRRRR